MLGVESLAFASILFLSCMVMSFIKSKPQCQHTLSVLYGNVIHQK